MNRLNAEEVSRLRKVRLFIRFDDVGMISKADYEWMAANVKIGPAELPGQWQEANSRASPVSPGPAGLVALLLCPALPVA